MRTNSVCWFEVGDFLDYVQKHLAPSGIQRVEREILTRRLRWSGFIIFDHVGEFETAAERLIEFALEGKIVYDEEILPGLEYAPGAIARLYRGANHGKLIIAVD